MNLEEEARRGTRLTLQTPPRGRARAVDLAGYADAEFAPPPDELELALVDSNRDNFRFLTFRNYFGAAALVTTETYGPTPYAGIARATRALPGLHRIQRRPLGALERRRAIKELRIAWTHEASLGRMATLASEDAPEIVMLDNQTLAQSAHFVLFHGATALGIAMRWPAPRNHAQALELLENQLIARGLVPAPWSSTISGGTTPRSRWRRPHTFAGFPSGVTTCDHQLQPSPDTMWSLLATALKTTRDKHPGFEARLKTWREANPPKRAHRRTTTRKRPVPTDVQDSFYAAMRATTVFDLIYRVRCRQQYQDDSSFLSSAISLRDALAFNRDLKLFTRASLHALEVVIQIAAGQELLDEARDDFRARVGGAIAGLSFDGRLERPAAERAG